MSKFKDITIKKVSNGYIVTAGCVTAVFNDEKIMFKEMKEYWKDPLKKQKEYVKEYAGLGPVNCRSSFENRDIPDNLYSDIMSTRDAFLKK